MDPKELDSALVCSYCGMAGGQHSKRCSVTRHDAPEHYESRQEPVPAWAAVEMSEYARWAGRWAGCSDMLALLVRRMPINDDTNAALAGYERLRADYENPRMVLPSAEPADA